MKKNNKGNPVPSLDSEEIKLILEALCAYGDDEEITDLCDKLENGVETNKEQPKCEHPYKRTHRVGDKAFCNKCKKPIH